LAAPSLDFDPVGAFAFCGALALFQMRLVFVQIFLRHIVFGHLAGAHFPYAASTSIFHARDDSSLERIAFLNQFVDAF